MNYTYSQSNRIGDHIWWVSDVRHLQKHYPNWQLTRNVSDILVEIHDELATRLRTDAVAANA